MELYKIIPPNNVREIIREKNKEKFSRNELKSIEEISREVRYIMDHIIYNSEDKFIGLTSRLINSKLLIEKRDNVVDIKYEDGAMSFTKLEDNYILITFGKDRSISLTHEVTGEDVFNAKNGIRFGVLCDDLDGIRSFHNEIMIKDNFIQKIMLGDKL